MRVTLPVKVPNARELESVPFSLLSRLQLQNLVFLPLLEHVVRPAISVLFSSLESIDSVPGLSVRLASGRSASETAEQGHRRWMCVVKSQAARICYRPVTSMPKFSITSVSCNLIKEATHGGKTRPRCYVLVMCNHCNSAADRSEGESNQLQNMDICPLASPDKSTCQIVPAAHVDDVAIPRSNAFPKVIPSQP